VVAPAVVHASRYKTRKGDTVVTVADRFGVTPVQLRRWNNLQGSHLAPGRMLAVSEPIHLAPRAGGSRHGHGKGHSQAQTASRGTHSGSGTHSRSAKAGGGKKPATSHGVSSSSKRVSSSSSASHSAKSTKKKTQ
jgi:membrane-bound lytic murein transglycosylase D